MNEQTWVHLNLILVTGMDFCAGSFATAFSKQIVMGSVERDNGNDQRAGTIDLNIENDAQVRLRVHRIVIRRYCGLAIIRSGNCFANSWLVISLRVSPSKFALSLIQTCFTVGNFSI